MIIIIPTANQGLITRLFVCCSVRGGLQLDLFLDPSDSDDSDVLEDLPGSVAAEARVVVHLCLPRPPTRQQYLTRLEPQQTLLPL